MFTAFLIFMYLVYLPAQWANGATLWESIAPNEPFMATIWMIAAVLIVCIIIGWFSSDSH